MQLRAASNATASASTNTAQTRRGDSNAYEPTAMATSSSIHPRNSAFLQPVQSSSSLEIDEEFFANFDIDGDHSLILSNFRSTMHH